MSDKRKPLFDTKITPIVQGDVSLQNGGDPAIEFAWQAGQWHEFVKGGVEALRRTRSINHWMSIGSSYIGFPIIYNYRHILELILKGILLAGNRALLLEGQPEISKRVLFGKHNFLDLWPDLVRVFKSLKISFDFGLPDLKTREDFLALLKEFDDLDPGSTVSRYPVDKEGQPSMGGKWVRFNVFEFAERLDPFFGVIREYPSYITEEVDQRYEWAYEMQQGAWEDGDYEPEYNEYDPE